jgi:hypothetical protein
LNGSDAEVDARSRQKEEIAMNHEAESSNQDQADAAILNVDIDDVAIEIAASGIGTIPTASVNMVPPNCCVQQLARKAG